MRIAIVIPPKDFRDETLKDALLMLRKWNVRADITSYSKSSCTGSHGMSVVPDINTARVHSDDYDGIVFLDGPGVDQYRLFDFRPLLDTTRVFAGKGKIVAAVGNGIKVIAHTNIINGVKIAEAPDKETSDMVRLYKGVSTRREVMSDRNIITAKGYGNVMEFIDAILVAAGLR